MGPTKLVLAVVAAVVVAVVAAIVAAVFQRHVVPGEIPYGLNVHVGRTEPRVFDGRCSVSIHEWFFEAALVSQNIFLSFKSAYAFRDRFGFVNGLKQVRLLRMKQTGTFDDYIHAFSSSTLQVKYMDDRTLALVFTSGFASDLRKEVYKEYPKKLRTAKRSAREANGTVQLLSSMNTRTTVRNEKNEQAPATAPSETDASNSLKNRPLHPTRGLRSWQAFPLDEKRLTSDARIGSRENDPDVVRPASQQRTQQGGQRRRNKDYDDEEIEPTEELRHGAHSLVKLINNVTLCMAVVTASMLAITSFSTAQQGYLSYTSFHEHGNRSSGQKLGKTFANVVIILVEILVVITVVLVCLLKYRCYKAVTGWVIGASVLALGRFFIYYMEKIWLIYSVCIDWIMASLISWNFSFVPPWTGWVLLTLIDVFELVANAHAVQAVQETGQASEGARPAAATVTSLLDDYEVAGGNGRQRAGARTSSQNES